jgi:hypothetical protein
MDAIRPHLSFPAEWITASIFLIATFAVGSLIVRELRVPPAPVVSASTQAEPTVTVPADAVSVPKLGLGRDVEVVVGDSMDVADAKLAAAALVERGLERGPLGPREIRSYNLAGTNFIVVVEPFERNGAPRVAAIFLR